MYCSVHHDVHCNIRDGWPLLTDETEVKRDSKRTNERGPTLVGSLGLSCRYKTFLFCIDCSRRPIVQTFFFLTYTISIPLSPSASKLGRQACMLGRLSLICVSGVTNSTASKYKERFKEFFADHLGSYVAFRLV
jgi:hypothetical protein